MRALTLLTLALLSSACAWRSIPLERPEPVCRLETPPPTPELTISDCEGWAACLTLEELLALERHLWASRRWQEDAWGRCGERP